MSRERHSTDNSNEQARKHSSALPALCLSWRSVFHILLFRESSMFYGWSRSSLVGGWDCRDGRASWTMQVEVDELMSFTDKAGCDFQGHEFVSC
jgi:hypothetical protein